MMPADGRSDALDVDLSTVLLEHAGGRDAAVRTIAQVEADTEAAGTAVRDAAWLALAAGDAPLATSLLRRAAGLAGDAGEAWFGLGLMRLGRGEDRGAQQAFVAAARALGAAHGSGTKMASRLRALRPEENRYAAIGIFYDAFGDGFACFAVARRVRPAERQHYGVCFDRALAYLGNSAAARSVLSVDLRLNGESFWYHVNAGHRAWLDGARDQADAHYLAARADALTDRVTPFHYNCGLLVWLSRARAEALFDAPATADDPGLSWYALPPGELPAGALLVGFDSRYFVFFPKFLLSAVRAYRQSGIGLPFALHCHIADAPAEQIAFVCRAALEINALLPGFRVSLSTAPAASREPAYYTCLRYLVLPGVLRTLRCGVVAMDVDSEILPEFFTAWPRIADHEFGLRMYSFDDSGRQIGGEPWSIGAHPTYVADTAKGNRFAGFLRAYIEAAYDPSLVTNWTIDQCAIARGHDLLLRDMDRSRILNFARGEPLYRLPNEFGGKLAFLNADPVTIGNFFERLRRQGSAPKVPV